MKKKGRISLLWLEIRLVFLVAMQYGLYDYLRRYQDMNPYAKSALEVACIVIIVLIIKTLRDIWRRELKSVIGTVFKKLVTRLAGVFMKYSDKLISYFKVKNVATGKTSVKFDYSVFKARKEKQVRFQPPKWKDMKHGREKLGYLYYRIITERIDRGEDVYASDTPSELRATGCCSEQEARVFDIYIKTRYDEREFVSEDEIVELKNSLF